eukprot:scaffold17200_cov58-Phaeocystis_antarctica.AAC.2
MSSEIVRSVGTVQGSNRHRHRPDRLRVPRLRRQEDRDVRQMLADHGAGGGIDSDDDDDEFNSAPADDAYDDAYM